MTERRFMLDTDTVSCVLWGQGNVATRLTAHAPSAVCLSAISLSELRYGADKRRSKRLHGLIDTLTDTIEVLPFDAAAAALFGRASAALAAKGTPIGAFDTLIAAHALSLKLILVTNKLKHFRQVRGLKTENWFSEPG